MSAENQRRIVLSIMDSEARARIRTVFEDLERELAVDGLGVAVTTSVLELVENAVKANLKRAFFERHGYSLDDAQSYSDGVVAFKQSYDRIKDQEYVRALGELELAVIVELHQDENRLLIHIENNAVLLAAEEARIRQRLAAAMNAAHLADFCMEYGDETEGSGLGLAMIVFLIRNLGFSAEHFRVFQQGPKTIARLEFPLSADYVPIRNRWKDRSDSPE